MPIFCFVLPTIVPVLFWNESWKISFISGCLRYVLSVNITWGINSVCHLWGYKPYDKSMGSRQSLFMALTALGEGNCAMNGTLLSKTILIISGWHNYHHCFPWDYKTAELSNYRTNITSLFVDAMASIGWAYDLRTASPEMIKTRMDRSGDGTNTSVWGLKERRWQIMKQRNFCYAIYSIT